MSEVVFFEKPGCIGNANQKRLLVGLGHRLVVRNLLSEPWTAERLRAFFGDLPVAEWFNPSAPRIKSGAVDPGALDQQEALALMIKEPLLIRRPLIETAEGRCCGFETNPVLDALGVQLGAGDDLQACPRATVNEPPCELIPANGAAKADLDGNRWR
jgi:nitrogenase-associated protein